ncbi:MAG: cupin domain-containing protein [Chloroflexi bacterium]|nr:MAG: cupin domain-containing protein [Chloroflexota bacterium]
MNKATLYANWKENIVYGSDGPQPQILLEDEKVKVILGGLEPGQKIPNHAEAQAIYHFLEGNGWMTVDDERMPVIAGSTIVLSAGTVRGMEAETRLAFLATRIA